MMQDKIEILKKEIEIPDIVQLKANDAFDRIRQEEKANAGKREAALRKKNRNRKPKVRIRRMIILAAAVILALGTVGFAYYVKWSRGLEKSLHTTEEVKIQAEKISLADFPEQSVTVNDVTVTAKQSIVDQHFAYLAFEVKGYDLREGAEPGFDGVLVTVDGEVANMSASFYDGILVGEDGSLVYEDGTPLQSDEAGNLITRYTAKDGTMEYHISLVTADEEDSFLNKPIHVELADLGTYPGKAMPVVTDVKGSWVFDWILQGSDKLFITDLNETLEGTNVSVIGAEISPISIKAVYNAPRIPVTETGINETTGETFSHETYVEPPALVGVKLKDGSFYPYLRMGPGVSGYEDENSDKYIEMFAIDRILDINQVEALLFLKGDSGNEERTTNEDKYYIVNIR